MYHTEKAPCAYCTRGQAGVVQARGQAGVVQARAHGGGTHPVVAWCVSLFACCIWQSTRVRGCTVGVLPDDKEETLHGV